MTSDLDKPRISLVVTDLDNTLFDWFAIWYESFSAMLTNLLNRTGLPRDQLEKEIREVHQRRGTAEYSYVINELPSLQKLHPGANLTEVYRDAIDQYRSTRRRVSRLYPGVLETLTHLKDEGVRVVAYTESLAYYSAMRLKSFGLDGIIDYLYSPPDHDFPEGISPIVLRTEDADSYELKRTEHRHTPPGVLKPEPSVLASILDELAESVRHTLYVGDSLMKDIVMAQKVGVFDVWAKYGVSQHREGYDLLRRVTHWTDKDVERERRIAANASAVRSTYVLERGFDGLLPLFNFGRVSID